MAEHVYETDLSVIAQQAMLKEEENDHFLLSLKHQEGAVLDNKVHAINKRVSEAIDCTQCGNCCRTLVINVTPKEVENLAEYLQQPLDQVKEQYIEESQQGKCFINSIPCSFFADKKCTIYSHRFTECRDFPHLHKNGFRERLPGTLMHYGRCPIIYNVIEELKTELDF